MPSASRASRAVAPSRWPSLSPLPSRLSYHVDRSIETRGSGYAPAVARPKRTVEVVKDEYRIQQFKLVVTGGPDRGREATSTGTEMSIGGAEGNVLVLADPTV